MELPNGKGEKADAGVNTSRPLSYWIRNAREQLSRFLNKNVVVVSLIGKDLPNRSKGDDLNDFLQMKVFSIPLDAFNQIDVFYSAAHDIVFLVVNNPSDVNNLAQVFCSGSQTENFFEKMKESEQESMNMLYFVSLVSHIILFLEPYPRFDMTIVRTLKSLNRIRLSSRTRITSLLEEAPEFADDVRFCKDGRLYMPRLLFAFQKTVIRSELGNSKKREIIQKLEQSLEDQIYSVLKQCRLIENGTGSSFGYIPYQKEHFVRLMVPSAASHNPLSNAVDFIMGKTEDSDEDADPITEGFPKFLRSHISSIRQQRGIQLPSLNVLIEIFKTVHDGIWNDESISEVVRSASSKELKLMEDLTKQAINEAVEQYSWHFGKEKERNVFTKAEHMQRFGAAVSYLDSVLVGPREQAMTKLRTRCDKLWQGGMQCCEHQSVSGNNCIKPLHPCVGDSSVSEHLWEVHDSGVTFISTCSCGRSQDLRRDPFSIKEANYDFLFNNAVFGCCKGLERHGFAVVEDDNEEMYRDETWNGEEDWPRPGGESMSNALPGSRNSKRVKRKVNSTSDSEDSTATGSDSNGASDEEVLEADEYRTGRSYMSPSNKNIYKDPLEVRKSAIAEFVLKLKKLEAKKINFLSGIPNSISPPFPPVFPSWSLTCIGPSNIYSHALGLRDQPNFKIACEYLLPVDIQLHVNPDVWEQDMDFVNAVEGTGYQRNRKAKRGGLETERVKLFVGFDYECPRGHRFFVDFNGEPLVLPKGHSGRDAACREAGLHILDVDLPLRRQCTCRKLPNQPAQLMKVHIVTPKAPVTVTVDPKVFIPRHDGYFHTGEGPLRLGWAKYYILQLPFVYSGQNGLWIPPKSLERVGTYKGNSIQVVYTPLEKK